MAVSGLTKRRLGNALHVGQFVQGDCQHDRRLTVDGPSGGKDLFFVLFDSLSGAGDASIDGAGGGDDGGERHGWE